MAAPIVAAASGAHCRPGANSRLYGHSRRLPCRGPLSVSLPAHPQRLRTAGPAPPSSSVAGLMGFTASATADRGYRGYRRLYASGEPCASSPSRSPRRSLTASTDRRTAFGSGGPYSLTDDPRTGRDHRSPVWHGQRQSRLARYPPHRSQLSGRRRRRSRTDLRYPNPDHPVAPASDLDGDDDRRRSRPGQNALDTLTSPTVGTYEPGLARSSRSRSTTASRTTSRVEADQPVRRRRRVEFGNNLKLPHRRRRHDPRQGLTSDGPTPSTTCSTRRPPHSETVQARCFKGWLHADRHVPGGFALPGNEFRHDFGRAAPVR